MNYNPYIEKAVKNAKQSKAYHRAPKQEKITAEKYGGYLTPKSGAGIKKGDVDVKNILRIECKTTQKKSFSITLEMLKKIENATIANSQTPAIIVEFLDANGKPIYEVAVVPTYVLEDLQ